MSRPMVCFWKPEQEDGYLGQWFPSKFIWARVRPDGTEEKMHYANAEQFMMHRKALLFAPDDPIARQILSPGAEAPHPRTLKALGRAVPNFSDEVWVKHRYEMVVEGNYLKFTQNPDLKEKLLATGDHELVEASPLDRIWGVGFGKKNAASQRDRWGLNLLGKALMEVRDRIRKEEEEK